MSHKSTLKKKKLKKRTVLNLLVAFPSPHSCTKASVVFAAGAAIRIMRPKGLSISQKKKKSMARHEQAPFVPLQGPRVQGRATTKSV